MDFTLDLFSSLLTALNDAGYQLMPVSDWNMNKQSGHQRQILLRHDVDRAAERSVATAVIEHNLGVRGTYYFRIMPESYDVQVIRQIMSLGHEIGYHYEDLDLSARELRAAKQKPGTVSEKDLAEMAYSRFRKNLSLLRELAPVSTICMHGSPRSRYDSRLLWKYFDYGELGIETEPYFDIPLDDRLYLTDTGRRWDGTAVSVRDRVYVRDRAYYEGWARKPVTGSAMAMTEAGRVLHYEHKFRKSSDIMESAIAGNLPEKMLLNIHPQRWSNSLPVWISELVTQNLKNVVKYFIKRQRFGSGN